MFLLNKEHICYPSWSGCSTLARSDTARGAITQSPSQRSMLLRPPRADLIGEAVSNFVKNKAMVEYVQLESTLGEVCLVKKELVGRII